VTRGDREPLILGVFEMLNPANGMPTWTHPLGKADRYADPGYWVSLAATLRDGGFDFLFFADTYGYATIDGLLPAEVPQHGIQFPGYDAMLLISALAQAVPDLGYVVTSPTSVEKPYATARRFASLDHYTGGRIGWNVVTGSSQDTVDRLFGITAETTHDSRYDAGDEFVEVCLAYWEGGYDDDALVNDPSSDVFIDPGKVHRVEYEGRHHRSSGYFAVPPTPQRTPVLFQAGTSARGRAFAARNAEAVLIQGQSIAKAAEHVADIRAKAAALGRDPRSLRVVTGATVTVAPTAEAAAALRADLEAQYRADDAAIIFAGFTGVDLRTLAPDTPLTAIDGAQGQTLLDRFVRPGQPVPTVGEVIDQFRLRANRGFQITGDPVSVADEIEAIVDGSDVDGIMLEPTFGGPDAFEAFIELVLPILRERGLAADKPAGLTLRERLGFGSARLGEGHPGARFRRARVAG